MRLAHGLERSSSGTMFITCAESCIGGWVAKIITDVSGSAGRFERGFITYSNQAKTDLLGVRPPNPGTARRGERSGGAGDGLQRLCAASANYAVAISGRRPIRRHNLKTGRCGLVRFLRSAGRSLLPAYAFRGRQGRVRRQAVNFALITLLATFL